MSVSGSTINAVNLEDSIRALRRLRADLRQLAERDPEQVVTGLALTTLDAVLTATRPHVRPSDPVLDAVSGLITVDAIEGGEDVRACDAFLVVGQLLSALDRATRPLTGPTARLVYVGPPGFEPELP
jgi:hypothetical protein